MMTPELEKRLMQKCRAIEDNWHGAMDADTIFKSIRPLLTEACNAGLEAAADWHDEQSHVAASAEIAAQESRSRRMEDEYCDLRHRHNEYAKAIRALKETP